MKSKKTLMGMVLLIGVLVLGIGYAAISTINLQINGTAKAAADGNFVVEFDEANLPTTPDNYLKSITLSESVDGEGESSGINDIATFSVEGMTAKGDTQTIVIPVTSSMEEDLQATLAVGTVSNDNPEYFNVTAAITADEASVLNNTTKTSSVTVTVELIKTPLESEEVANISIPLTATPSVK